MAKYITFPASAPTDISQAKFHASESLSGLTNGTSYIAYRLSEPSGSFTPQSTATAPLQITDWTWATGLAANQIALAITAPGNGGSAITGYEYSLDGGTTVVALTGASPWVLPMAAAGTSYSAVVRARNAVGAGPWSASKTATSGAAA
ncbi:MAG TPA: hypothetical protein VGC40_10180, partial [Paenirhodobacter sp.]